MQILKEDLLNTFPTYNNKQREQKPKAEHMHSYEIVVSDQCVQRHFPQVVTPVSVDEAICFSGLWLKLYESKYNCISLHDPLASRSWRDCADA